MVNDYGVNDYGAVGILIIGDVHLSSLRPERRKDDYASAILKKVKNSLSIAKKEKLIPVFLGDMFHRHVEKDEALKTELSELLAESWVTPIVNTGNHDKHGDVLQKGDTLAWYLASKIIKVCTKSGSMGEYILDGIRVGIGMTPYGQEIPDSADNLFPDAQGIIWFTHHDLAFEGAYPKSLPLKTISGCGIAVNGHIHLRKPIIYGETTWCNFGSLSRTAIDAIDHIPSVVGFYPSKEDMFVFWPLEHDKDVFDLTGRLIPAMPSLGGSFASIAIEELLSDASRTDSGTIFSDELKDFLENQEQRPEISSIIMNLCTRVMSEN